MSHLNNMTLRAKFAQNGSITSFELSNYSGGGSMNLRAHRMSAGDLYWVIDAGGFSRTLLFAPASDWPLYDHSDLDQLGLEALRLCRTDDGLEERDARLRMRYEERTGERLPMMLPVPDESKVILALGG